MRQLPSTAARIPNEVLLVILEWALHPGHPFTTSFDEDSFYFFVAPGYEQDKIYAESEKRRCRVSQVCKSWRAVSEKEHKMRWITGMHQTMVFLAVVSTPSSSRSRCRPQRILWDEHEVKRCLALLRLHSSASAQVRESVEMFSYACSELGGLRTDIILKDVSTLFPTLRRLEITTRWSQNDVYDDISNNFPHLRTLSFICASANVPPNIHGQLKLPSLDTLELALFPEDDYAGWAIPSVRHLFVHRVSTNPAITINFLKTNALNKLRSFRCHVPLDAHDGSNDVALFGPETWTLLPAVHFLSLDFGMADQLAFLPAGHPLTTLVHATEIYNEPERYIGHLTRWLAGLPERHSVRRLTLLDEDGDFAEYYVQPPDWKTIIELCRRKEISLVDGQMNIVEEDGFVSRLRAREEAQLETQTGETV